MVFKDLTSEILVNVILLHKNVKEWSDKAWKDIQKEGYTESNFFHILAEKMLCEYLLTLSDNCIKDIEALYWYAREAPIRKGSDLKQSTFNSHRKYADKMWEGKVKEIYYLTGKRNLSDELMRTIGHLGLSIYYEMTKKPHYYMELENKMWEKWEKEYGGK